MADVERRNYLALAKHNKVDEVVMNWLVGRGLIPKDIELRALLESERVEDDTYLQGDRYVQLLNDAVLAALEGDDAPDFLTKPYPDIMSFDIAADWKGLPSLSMVPEDFYAFGSLYRQAEKSGVNSMMMFTLWHRIITEINPQAGQKMVERGRKTQDWYWKVSRTRIRDEPAYEVYQDGGARKRLRVGIGERAVKQFGLVLADNHPELFEQLELD